MNEKKNDRWRERNYVNIAFIIPVLLQHFLLKSLILCFSLDPAVILHYTYSLFLSLSLSLSLSYTCRAEVANQ